MMVPGMHNITNEMRYSERIKAINNNIKRTYYRKILNSYNPLRAYDVFYTVSGKLFANKIPFRYRKLVNEFLTEYNEVVGIVGSPNNQYFADEKENKTIERFSEIIRISNWIQRLISSQKYKITKLPEDNDYVFTQEHVECYFTHLRKQIHEERVSIPSLEAENALDEKLYNISINWDTYNIDIAFLISMDELYSRIQDFKTLPSPQTSEIALMKKEINALLELVDNMNEALNQKFRNQTFIPSAVKISYEGIKDDEVRMLIEQFLDRSNEYEELEDKSPTFYTIMNELSQILNQVDIYNEIPEPTRSSLIDLIKKSTYFVDTLLQKNDSEGMMQTNANIVGITKFVEFQLATHGYNCNRS